MTEEEYIILYRKFLSGAATPEEAKLLSHYTDEFDIDKFDNEERLIDQELIKDKIYQQIEQKITVGRNKIFPKRLWWSVAASFLLLSGIGLYIMVQHLETKKGKLEVFAKAQKSIVPGTNKAILILANGDQIDLDQTQNGHITQAGKINITKLKNGQLAYGKANPVDGKERETAFNTIITPRGGQYMVRLPDGTSVWLNSASSLRYPVSFTGSERHVKLEGEAYFEVAKNKKLPFTVDAGKVMIKVLGTHFNISAYDDEPSSKTTLLEGSVRLSRNHQQVTLTPGQQAIAESEKLLTKPVNVEDAIAWKKGYFSFRKETLETAMRKIARWYDVEIVYQGKLSTKLLGGSVLRTENLSEVLKTLELTEIADFKIEGRRIMVKPN